MPRSDYIPASDKGFYDWEKNLIAFALQNFSRWKVPDLNPEITTLQAAFEVAYAAYLNPNKGKIDTDKKNKARAFFEKAVRVYNKAYLLYNPAVTDEERLAMRLPVHEGTRHPVQVPTTAPELVPNTSLRRYISVQYRDEESGKRGKPDGVQGVEVRWDFRETVPDDIEELTHSAFDTSSPLKLEFKEHERGKKVFMCGRWQIAREGEKGPWGAVVEAIVP